MWCPKETNSRTIESRFSFNELALLLNLLTVCLHVAYLVSRCTPFHRLKERHSYRVHVVYSLRIVTVKQYWDQMWFCRKFVFAALTINYKGNRLYVTGQVYIRDVVWAPIRAVFTRGK